jgi:predicted RNA binding protein YcfA (HicA-like mRNA interferase family)
MKHPMKPLLVTIPKHKELKIGTMRSELKKAGLTIQDVVDALREI